MNEEMRKEFAKEYSQFSGYDVLFDDYGVPFVGGISKITANSLVQAAWWGWKKSREAMNPIKLPLLMKNTQEQACYYYNDAIYECKEAIKQAGYKVAE